MKDDDEKTELPLDVTALAYGEPVMGADTRPELSKQLSALRPPRQPDMPEEECNKIAEGCLAELNHTFLDHGFQVESKQTINGCSKLWVKIYNFSIAFWPNSRDLARPYCMGPAYNHNGFNNAPQKTVSAREAVMFLEGMRTAFAFGSKDLRPPGSCPIVVAWVPTRGCQLPRTPFIAKRHPKPFDKYGLNWNEFVAREVKDLEPKYHTQAIEYLWAVWHDMRERKIKQKFDWAAASEQLAPMFDDGTVAIFNYDYWDLLVDAVWSGG